MKKQKILLPLIIVSSLLVGCSKTEKDVSFDTDLYGEYKNEIIASNIDYEKIDSYVLNTDDTYVYKLYEKINGKVTSDFTKNDKINNINNINDDVVELILNNEKSSNNNIYKYKNMLGYFYKTEIPNSKTFNLIIKDEETSDSGSVFSSNGYYHYCTDYDNCTDDSSNFIKYKHKGNHIYQADSKGNWTILYYIVDGGLFSGTYTKSE